MEYHSYHLSSTGTNGAIDELISRERRPFPPFIAHVGTFIVNETLLHFPSLLGASFCRMRELQGEPDETAHFPVHRKAGTSVVVGRIGTGRY